MTKNIIQRIIAIVLAIVAVVMACVGAFYLPQRNGVAAQNAVREMRIRALLDVTGAGLVDTYVDIARANAMAEGKAQKKSLAERKVMAEAAMAAAREQYENQEIDYSALDTTALEPVVDEYATKLGEYYNLRAEAMQTYVDSNMAAAKAKAEAERQKLIDEGKELGEEKEVTVDVSNFDKIIKALHAINPDDLRDAAAVTEVLYAAQGEMNSAFAALREVIKAPCDTMTDAAVNSLRTDVDKALNAGKEAHIAYHADVIADAADVAEDDPILVALQAYIEKQTLLNTATAEANAAAAPTRAAADAHTAAENAVQAEAAALSQSQEAFAAYMNAMTAYNTAAEAAAAAQTAADEANAVYAELQATADACAEEVAALEAAAAEAAAVEEAVTAEETVAAEEANADEEVVAETEEAAVTEEIVAEAEEAISPEMLAAQEALAAAEAAAQEAHDAYLALQSESDAATAAAAASLTAAQTANGLYLEKQAAYEACVEATAAAQAAVAPADTAAKNAEDNIAAKQEAQEAAQTEADAAYEALTQAIVSDFAAVDAESLTALRGKINAAILTNKAGYITYKAVVTQTANPVHATTGYDARIADYADKLAAYKAADTDAKEKYDDTNIDDLLKVRPEVQAELLTLTDDIELANEVTAALAVADEYFAPVGEKLKEIYPVLDNNALKTLKPSITDVIMRQSEGYTELYDRYMEAGCGEALTNPEAAWMIRYADDLLYGALALLVLAAIVLYYETLCKKLGIPRIVLGMFFILLCFMCLWFDLSLATLLSNSLVRMGMNAVMVLAMVPGIQCGISLNLGLPIGLVAGLIGGLVTIEWGIPGVWGFIVAVLVGCIIAAVCGWLYAQLLNRLKGEEMSVTTYVGFSIVSLMCIAWLVLPFTSLKLRWPMGTGLRNTIGLDNTNFKHILDDFLAFEIGGFTVPTGLLLFMGLMCFLVWIFTRTKTGVAMQAVGNNPRFAEATGINVDKMRVIGTVLSTVLGAIGILVYSQSYGFMQLYTAPRQMGFIAASAILIGGATTTRCKISHVLIGTFLFQGVLTLGMPVANELVPGSTISETLRILISNGIILYALTKSGGESRA